MIQKRMSNPSDWPLGTPEWKDRHEVYFEFSVDSPLLFTYYSPDRIIYIDQPSEIVFDNRSLEKINLIAVLANPALHRGEKYRTVSLISSPTDRELRTSGQNYPKDILDRYIQLPENFSKSIINLAADITVNEKNAYDKTIAITRYLRSNITYSDTLPPKPAGKDVLEWILFDHKEGFCNYYASLEVLMLRSIGIPARLAVGYAEGAEQEGGDEYQVLKKDSHAWPEVFFPGYGWIEFEPTASQPPLDYPSGDPTIDENPDSIINPGDFPSGNPGVGRLGQEEEEIFLLDEVPTNPINTVQVFILTVILIGLMGLGIFLYKRIQSSPSHLFLVIRKSLKNFGLHVPDWLEYLTVMTQITPVEQYYLKILWLEKLLKVQQKEGWSPAERLAALSLVYPSISLQSEILLEEYQKRLYSQSGEDSARAYDAYQILSSYLLGAWLRKLLKK